MIKLPTILLTILSLAVLNVYGQYYGGEEDGYSSGEGQNTIMFPEEAIFSGGDADGSSTDVTEMLSLNAQDIYCDGGNSDGYSSVPSGLLTLNAQALYCGGGDADGNAQNSYSGYFFDPTSAFTGGDGDGWSAMTYDGYFFDPLFAFGGEADGTTVASSGNTTVNEQLFYCRAGDYDGYSSGLFDGQFLSFLFCQGGNGDGQISLTSGTVELGNGIWTGEVSDSWSLAANWKHGILPDVNTNILIQHGAPHYPLLTQSLSINSYYGTLRCKRLDIKSGGELITYGILRIDGTLNVQSELLFHNTGTNLLQIGSQGKLKVKDGGVMTVE